MNAHPEPISTMVKNSRAPCRGTRRNIWNESVIFSCTVTSWLFYLEEMRDVVENGPALDVVAEVLDLVVVDAVEEE